MRTKCSFVMLRAPVSPPPSIRRRLPRGQASRKSLGANLQGYGAGNTRTIRRRSHTNMKVDSAHLQTIANTTGFPPDNLKRFFVFVNSSLSSTSIASEGQQPEVAHT